MLNKIINLIVGSSISKKTTYVHLILISFLTLFVYLNTFGNQFVLDDRTIFFNWPDVKNANILNLVQGSYPERFRSEPVYRPVKSIIHAIDYKVSKNNPNFYHLQAILVNLGITILIYFIIKTIFKKNLLALLSSLIFGIHPSHTEAVTFLTASFDTLGILFFCSALLLYIKNVEKNKKTYLFFSVFFAFLAFFTYELTLTLPLILALYDVCFQKEKANWKIKFKTYSLYWLGILAYFFLRNYFVGNLIYSNYLLGSINITFLTMLKAILRYITLIIFPNNLSMIQILPGGIESAIGNNPNIEATIKSLLKQNIFEPTILLSLSLIGTLTFMFFKYLNKQPIISFSIGWFFICLLPVLNIIPIRQILAIRYEYLASLGIILLLTYFILEAFDKYKNRKIIKYLLILTLITIISLFSLKTISRNNDFKDHISLLKTLANQEVGGDAAKYYLGKYYYYKNDFAQTIYYLKDLSNIKNPIYKDSNYFLTIAYTKTNQNLKAKNSYSDLIKLYPDYNSTQLITLKKIINSGKTENVVTIKNNKINTYNSSNKFSFNYPSIWAIKEQEGQTVLSNKTAIIKITYSPLVGSTTITEYLKNSSTILSLGKLIQEGRASIPSAEFSYIKIWDNQGEKIANFFLFKKQVVIEVIISPFDENTISDLNLILNSIKFN